MEEWSTIRREITLKEIQKRNPKTDQKQNNGLKWPPWALASNHD